jgi:hypothetical protein
MSTTTAFEFRSLIDDVDAVLRKAVVEKNLREIFTTEKKRIVRFIFIITLFALH